MKNSFVRNIFQYWLSGANLQGKVYGFCILFSYLMFCFFSLRTGLDFVQIQLTGVGIVSALVWPPFKAWRRKEFVGYRPTWAEASVNGIIVGSYLIIVFFSRQLELSYQDLACIAMGLAAVLLLIYKFLRKGQMK